MTHAISTIMHDIDRMIDNHVLKEKPVNQLLSPERVRELLKPKPQQGHPVILIDGCPVDRLESLPLIPHGKGLTKCLRQMQIGQTAIIRKRAQMNVYKFEKTYNMKFYKCKVSTQQRHFTLTRTS